MSSGFLRIGVVMQRTGFSRSLLYAKVAKGEFPSQVALGARAVGWIESEVEEWIHQRIRAARGAGSVPPPASGDGLRAAS